MAFYNLGHGGDPTSNSGYALYPQNQALGAFHPAKGTLLRPAEHMASATYNIWRNLNFLDKEVSSNLGSDQFLRELVCAGTPLAVGDIIGMVQLPHKAIVQGLHWDIESAQADTVLQIVRFDFAAQAWVDYGAPIDASAISCGFIPDTFVVPCDGNELFAIRIEEWPAPTAGTTDPCGIYPACEMYTLCLTLNAFMWYPVSTTFCKSDPCFGLKP